MAQTNNPAADATPTLSTDRSLFITNLRRLKQENRACQQGTRWWIYTTDREVSESWARSARWDLRDWVNWNEAQWSLDFEEELPTTAARNTFFSATPFVLMNEKILPRAEVMPPAIRQAVNSVAHMSNQYICKPAATAAGVGALVAVAPLIVVGTMVAGPFICVGLYNALGRR